MVMIFGVVLGRQISPRNIGKPDSALYKILFTARKQDALLTLLLDGEQALLDGVEPDGGLIVSACRAHGRLAPSPISVDSPAPDRYCRPPHHAAGYSPFSMSEEIVASRPQARRAPSIQSHALSPASGAHPPASRTRPRNSRPTRNRHSPARNNWSAPAAADDGAARAHRAVPG